MKIFSFFIKHGYIKIFFTHFSISFALIFTVVYSAGVFFFFVHKRNSFTGYNAQKQQNYIQKKNIFQMLHNCKKQQKTCCATYISQVKLLFKIPSSLNLLFRLILNAYSYK